MSREWNLDHIGEGAQIKKESISLFPQIKEDFKLIQIVNNDLMKLVFVKKIVDYKLIFTSTEEINKRARRLEKNLLLPQFDTGKNLKYQEASDVEQLKASLLSFDSLLMRFITNPLFNSPNVINPDSAGAAERDLKNIIHFSDAIKSNVRKLNKTAKQ